MSSNFFYTYAYIDPRKEKHTYGDFVFNGEPFYIGKGKGSCRYKHLNETLDNTKNTLKVKKIQRIRDSGLEPTVEILKHDCTENEAFELEQKLIKLIGTKWNIPEVPKGPLCNMSSGGEGFTPCDDLRSKYSRPGELNGMYGKKHTEESKKKISENSKKLKHSNITRAKMSQDRSGNKNYTSQVWIIKFPDGSLCETDDLKEFCKERKIPYTTMHGSYYNQREITKGNAKGYCVVSKLTKGISHTVVSKWELLKPNGDIEIITTNLRDYCIRHNLKYGTIWNSFRTNQPVSRGPYKGYWLVRQL